MRQMRCQARSHTKTGHPTVPGHWSIEEVSTCKRINVIKRTYLAIRIGMQHHLILGILIDTLDDINLAA